MFVTETQMLSKRREGKQAQHRRQWCACACVFQGMGKGVTSILTPTEKLHQLPCKTLSHPLDQTIKATAAATTIGYWQEACLTPKAGIAFHPKKRLMQGLQTEMPTGPKWRPCAWARGSGHGEWCGQRQRGHHYSTPASCLSECRPRVVLFLFFREAGDLDFHLKWVRPPISNFQSNVSDAWALNKKKESRSSVAPVLKSGPIIKKGIIIVTIIIQWTLS